MYYEVILDALRDTALLLPLLLAVHLVIEFFETRSLARLKSGRVLKGGMAPLLGTGVGLLPQCGFSVVAGDMYAKRYIRIGTLLAVFVATSDEALPILLGNAIPDPSMWLQIGLLIGIKVAMALIAGYGLNAIFRKRELAAGGPAAGSEYGCCGHAVTGAPRECEQNPDRHDHDREDGGRGEHGRGESKAKHIWHTYFKHPVVHTLVTGSFILAVNLLLGSIIFWIGKDALESFMSANVWWQPLFAGLVGLIPNCASSVLLAEMFAGGALTLGAATAGLAINAGLGFAVLFKENKNTKENLAILAGAFAYAVAVGYIITIICEVLL